MQKAPNVIAQELSDYLKDKTSDFFSSFQAVGPYLNAFLNVEYLARNTITSVQEKKENY